MQSGVAYSACIPDGYNLSPEMATSSISKSKLHCSPFFQSIFKLIYGYYGIMPDPIIQG